MSQRDVAVMDAGAEEHVFYVAGAVIVGVRRLGEYRLWLIDGTNEQTVRRWQAGEPVPESDCIDLNCNYTFEHSGPQGQIHTIDSNVYAKYEQKSERRLAAEALVAFHSPGSVAISETLWTQIPPDRRPLPPFRDQPYRLQVIARRSATGAYSYYAGFHVKIAKKGAGTHADVQFFTWTGLDGPVATYTLDLQGPAVLPAGDHTTVKDEGDEGALFVSFDQLGNGGAMPLLEAPKVQYSGGAPGTDGLGRAVAAESIEPHVRPLLVVSSGSDSWLQSVRAQFKADREVEGEAGVLRAIDELVTQFGERREVQLISHSNDDNLLVFGQWTLNEYAFAGASADLKRKLAGKVLRLVGCNTANGGRARATLHALASRLGVIAKGVGGLIMVPDFGPDGLLPERSTLLGDGTLAGRREAEVDRVAMLAGLDDRSRRAVQKVLATVDRVPLRGFDVKGLLRKPSEQVALSGPDGAPAGSIDRLFRGDMVRIARAGTEWVFTLPGAEIRAQLQPLFT